MSRDAAAQIARARAQRPLTAEEQRLADRAVAMYNQARTHKREAARHRGKAKIAMRHFDEFRHRLEAMGIIVVVEPPSTPTTAQRRAQ